MFIFSTTGVNVIKLFSFVTGALDKRATLTVPSFLIWYLWAYPSGAAECFSTLRALSANARLGLILQIYRFYILTIILAIQLVKLWP